MLLRLLSRSSPAYLAIRTSSPCQWAPQAGCSRPYWPLMARKEDASTSAITIIARIRFLSRYFAGLRPACSAVPTVSPLPMSVTDQRAGMSFPLRAGVELGLRGKKGTVAAASTDQHPPAFRRAVPSPSRKRSKHKPAAHLSPRSKRNLNGSASSTILSKFTRYLDPCEADSVFLSLRKKKQQLSPPANTPATHRNRPLLLGEPCFLCRIHTR